MTYNLSNITSNATGVLDLVQGVNDTLMFGWLGVFILIGLMFVIISSTVYVTNDMKKAALVSGFLGAVLSIFMRAMDLIPNKAVIIFIILCAVMIGFGYTSD